MSTKGICAECGNSVDEDDATAVSDDVGLCRSCFVKTAEAPAIQPPAKISRRTRWITGAAGAAVAVVGIGVAVALSKNEVKITGRGRSGGGRGLDLRTIVQGHPKQQAYGPTWSLHREISIEPYLRGPARAA
jgi:hypothetical protein